MSSDDFLRVLADRVRRLSTVAGYMTEGDLTPIGSGTIVRRTDGQCGILTAGHVVGAIKKATKNNGGIWVLPAQDRRELDWVRIEGMCMYGWGERNTGQRGPDIGWMPLSAHVAKCVEALGACSTIGKERLRTWRWKYVRSPSSSDSLEPRAVHATRKSSHMRCFWGEPRKRQLTMRTGITETIGWRQNRIYLSGTIPNCRSLTY